MANTNTKYDWTALSVAFITSTRPLRHFSLEYALSQRLLQPEVYFSDGGTPNLPKYDWLRKVASKRKWHQQRRDYLANPNPVNQMILGDALIAKAIARIRTVTSDELSPALAATYLRLGYSLKKQLKKEKINPDKMNDSELLAPLASGDVPFTANRNR